MSISQENLPATGQGNLCQPCRQFACPFILCLCARGVRQCLYQPEHRNNRVYNTLPQSEAIKRLAKPREAFGALFRSGIQTQRPSIRKSLTSLVCGTVSFRMRFRYRLDVTVNSSILLGIS